MRSKKRMSEILAVIMMVILLLIIVTLLFIVQEAQGPGRPVEFETILQASFCNEDYFGPLSANSTGSLLVIRNGTHWREFWNDFTGGIFFQRVTVENVTWHNELVLVAFYGYATDCCKHVEFTSVWKDGRTLYAYVRWTNQTPGPCCLMCHCPFHIIAVRSALNVVFVEDKGTEYELNWWAVVTLIALIPTVVTLYWKAHRIPPESMESPRTEDAGR